jgi:PncC family amidohydrolase
MKSASEDDVESLAAQYAQKLAILLEENQVQRVVFAESCTAGLVSALLGQVPGISSWLCGSAVTYRESIKQDWLAVSVETLGRHTAESMETTQQMATGVLSSTQEATFSVAVTGHLGLGASPEIDGLIFVAVAQRMGDKIEVVASNSVRLNETGRIERQHESAKLVLDAAIQFLSV